jgi:MFS family permease
MRISTVAKDGTKKPLIKNVVMCRCLPKSMRIHLKKRVSYMSMIACFMYDLALFLIFAVNIMFHDSKKLDFAMTELSLLVSCFIFGILFEIVGRKRIFTMRLIVTSVASLSVPFIDKLAEKIPLVNYIPVQSLSFVMCSVSLTVPVISDFVKYRRRGVAYGYMGVIFAVSVVTAILLDDFHVDQTIGGKQWLYIGTSVFGIVVALSLCSFIKDRIEFKIELKL